MRTETIVAVKDPQAEFAKSALPDATVVFYFVSPGYPHRDAYFEVLKKAYPSARMIGCSTGGEIGRGDALVDSAVSTAIRFKHTKVKIAQTKIEGIPGSHQAGKELAQELAAPDLNFIFILGDGLRLNGNELIRGIMEHVDDRTILTGGFAGDGFKFKQTCVGVDGPPETGKVAAIGFYGDKLNVSYGTAGGWVTFGAMRRITRSAGNVLYELDGNNALDLYKKYLGDAARDLPASGQFYPLCIRPSLESKHEIVRAFSAINDDDRSLLFAGDIPQGYVAQLMHGNSDNLAEGAGNAAASALEQLKRQGTTDNAIALLVSCVGRNMMMGKTVSDEVAAVEEALDGIPLSGFYSYGEICHHSQTGKCDFHNQTMTITLLAEEE